MPFKCIVLFFKKDTNVDHSRSYLGGDLLQHHIDPAAENGLMSSPLLDINNFFSPSFCSLLKKHLTPGFPFPLSGCVVSLSKGI